MYTYGLKYNLQVLIEKETLRSEERCSNKKNVYDDDDDGCNRVIVGEARGTLRIRSAHCILDDSSDSNSGGINTSCDSLDMEESGESTVSMTYCYHGKEKEAPNIGQVCRISA